MRKLLVPVCLFLIINLAQAQHTVVLKDGDMIKGEVTRYEHETLTIITNNVPVELRLDRIRTIHFQEQTIPSAKASGLEKTFSGPDGRVRYTMDARNMIKFPKITLGSKDNGLVVVDVVIDRYGNVKSAEPGAAGTRTTNDAYLFPKAKLACQEAKFDSDPKAPLQTSGQIFVEIK